MNTSFVLALGAAFSAVWVLTAGATLSALNDTMSLAPWTLQRMLDPVIVTMAAPATGSGEEAPQQ